MSILIVGNVLKDVYLDLDSRTEHFESDKHGTKWLDFGFNASEHHFWGRNSSFGGAAISLEVLTKLGLSATITGTDLKLGEDGFTSNQSIEVHRYILLADNDRPCYLVPSSHQTTPFATPADVYDCLYIDRSANLDQTAISKINAYLDISTNTKLVLYLSSTTSQTLTSLIPRADLIFLENHPGSAAPLAPTTVPSGQATASPEQTYALSSTPPSKLIQISDHQLSYQAITEPISTNRIDMKTHLSTYSIAAATILGSFILGHTVEDSLKLARINVESSKLNAALSLSELQNLLANQPAPNNTPDNIELIAKNLVLHPKGILAADESGGSIHKKFDQLQIEDTYETRRDYRNIFFTTPNLAQYINGVILFDETARQFADNGQNFVDSLTSKRIIPGIKVDQGLEKIANSEETYTKGLDNLPSRLAEYYQMGLRFAKWRAAFEIRLDDQGNLITPTDHAIAKNCQILADYALECQKAGLVPIVEPELVYDGYYDIDQSASVTGRILDALFAALAVKNVNLKACILKCNMVLAGKKYEKQSTPDEIRVKTAEVLKAYVPNDLAGVVFLSGGQTPEQATANLAAITKNGPYPWPVTFSFARALQDPALYAWAGDNNNAEKARQAFADRLLANQQALII